MNTYETADYFRQPLLKRAHDIYSLFLVGALIGWLTIPAAQPCIFAAALEYAICRFLWHGALCAVACPFLARL